MLVFLFILALGIRLLLIFLRVHPAGDEVWALFLAETNFYNIWLATFADLHGPAYFLFLRVLKLFYFPLNLFSLRLISLFFGMLSCVGMWHLGNSVFGRKGGLVTLVLSLFLPASIWAAIFGRYYSILIFLTTISIICFVRFVHTGNYRMLFWLSLISAVGVYTHYYFMLLPVSYAVFLFLTKNRYSGKMFVQFLISIGVVTLLFMPGLNALLTLPKPELVGRHENSLLKLPALVITNIVSSETLIFLYLWGKWYIYIPILAVLAVAVILLVVQAIKSWSGEMRNLFLSILLVPPIITTVFAYIVKPLLSLGSLQIYLPAWVFFLAKGIEEDLKKSKLLTVLFGTTVCVSLFFLFQTSFYYAHPRKDFAFFINSYSRGDIVLHSHLGSYLLASYYKGRENNFEIIRNKSVTVQTAEGVGFNPISMDGVKLIKAGVWYFESPFVSVKDTVAVKAQLSERFQLTHTEQFWKAGDAISETYFNVYYYEPR